MYQLNRLRNHETPWTHDNTESLYACTGCRQCTNYCEHDNEPGLVLFAGRAEANARGASHPALINYPARFRARDTRLAQKMQIRFAMENNHVTETSQENEGAHATLPALPLVEPESSGHAPSGIGFFPGCDSIDKDPEGIEVALRLFADLGVPSSGPEGISLILSQTACAGYPLLAAGYPDMFRWQANRVANEIRQFDTVIVNCSACVYSMRSQYRAEGVELKPEILSVPEFIVKHIQKLPRPAESKPIYYHDPCYLARYSGVVEPPRKILAKVSEIHEFSWSGADADCCGGAGLLPKTMPKIANRMAKDRLQDLSYRGGGTVVTSCGTCAFMLKSNAPDNIEVKDLATAISDALSDPSDLPRDHKRAGK